MRKLIFILTIGFCLIGYGFSNVPAEGFQGYVVPETRAASDKYRLVWNDDPTSTMTIIWDQLQEGNAKVYYGTKDQGRFWWRYPNKQDPTRVLPDFFDMNTCYTKLHHLQDDQTYYFVIKDDFGVSDRFYFITASERPEPFTFIAGGDTKSNEPHLAAGRASNQMVSKLRPLFVVFNGDYTSGAGNSPENWHQWLRDWDLLTTTDDGRKFPIVPVQGNHECGDPTVLTKIFDAPFKGYDPVNIYYSLSFGGRFFHIIALNSEVDPGGDQRKWLEADLAEHENFTFKIAGYHRPFVPHTDTDGKRNQDYLYRQWAGLFYEYGLDLSMDADAHVHKITYPLKPSMDAGAVDGFVRDDDRGTVYIGEGSWGVMSRQNNKNRPWTMQSGSFNQFKWIHVRPECPDHPAFMEIFTVITSRINSDGTRSFYVDDVERLTDNNSFKIPENINLFTVNRIQSVKYPYYLNQNIKSGK